MNAPLRRSPASDRSPTRSSSITGRRRRSTALLATLLALVVTASACAADEDAAVDTDPQPSDVADADAEGEGTAVGEPADGAAPEDDRNEGADDESADADSGDDEGGSDEGDSGDEGTDGENDSAGGGDFADEPGARVARHIDGDSLELDIDGEVVEVRIAGINAPEGADCQGDAARDALAELLDGRGIEVVGAETDRFGRVLAELYVGGEPVGEAMVRAGWALAIHGEGDAYIDEMIAAAEAGLGWWAGAVGDCPEIDADIRIVDAEPDPPGRDDENMNGEYVVVANFGDRTVDLDGWQLRDESTGNRFLFPSVDIGPGDEVVVYTGCGQDRRGEVYWCSEFPVWSNEGETVMLLGPEGTHVAHLFLEGR